MADLERRFAIEQVKTPLIVLTFKRTPQEKATVSVSNAEH
jgi:hypothetical protein